MYEDWVKAIREDEIAFNDFVEQYRKDMFLIARTRLNQVADVEDAIQDTLFDVFTKIKNLKNEKCFKSWAIRILINNCNDIIRENKDAILYNSEMLNDFQDESYNEINEEKTFNEMIDFLSSEEKEILFMKYSDNYSYSEISKILNIKEGTLRMKVLRIKEKIKERYQNDT